MWKKNLYTNESRKGSSISEGGNNLVDVKSDNKTKQVSVKTVDPKISEIENQSGGVDSGFLSGPQLSSCDIEYTDSDEDSVNSDKKIKSKGDPDINDDLVKKKTNKLEQQQQYSDINQGSDKEYTDSGCLEDTDISRDKSEGEHMILDSGVDSGLTEWFCNLSIKGNQPLNNLGSKEHKNGKKSFDQNSLTSLTSKGNKDKQPWEIYYQQNNDGDTQLHLACMSGNIDVVSALIRLAPHPCLLDIQNDEAHSALHLAVITGQSKIVRLLVLAGAEVLTRDGNGNTPLHLACLFGDVDCVTALMIPFSAQEMQDAEKARLLKYDKSTYPLCAQLPPDLEIRNYDGERCVHLAAQGSHIEILRHLVWFGADINAREGKSGRTPLHIAIEMRNEDLANFLLEECQKLNLETATYAGLTAYQLAVILRNQQIQLDLERRGAEPLTPPESDNDSDIESDFDDSQIFDRFGDPGFFVHNHSGCKTINVA